ncbi:GGDEF domain-containing phosphodiesterase [Eubacterium sp. 1001713B170207_170306_E7]|uniref:putative bifunctional diguanylate cyclase/phosphodiesterase n=1 Tax=Eubacterium sp. 1001713B170207_170306_E7 TaxID=2787097 RepID=UPI001896FBF3|nr:GGDEF domain-containing phosphodiesterase [Eubacterium sp. 1001713B170207_170306_E7]
MHFVNEGQNIRQLFSEDESLEALLNPTAGQVVSASLRIRGGEGRCVWAASKRKGEQLLFAMWRVEDVSEVPGLMKLYVSMTDDLELVQQEPYESSYYEIQKVNNQLINYQRALTKANERLRMLLEEVRAAKSTIELLERDPVTSLYTQNAFFDRAAAFLEENPQMDFDIIAVDIERFKMVNDAFGNAAGDKLLTEVALCLLNAGEGEPALFARARADKFYALVPRCEKIYDALDWHLGFLEQNHPLPMRLQVKLGIYHIEDRTLGVPRMCDRAVLAAGSIKGFFDKRCAFYDDSIREKMIMEQNIIDTMTDALEEETFQVYLQPKVEIGTGRLMGAEALVRWQHPRLGMISPGDFIPVFEKNGFIYALDQFVWRKTCEIMGQWKRDGGNFIPISVNVSRVDIYHSDLPEILVKMVEENGLKPEDLHLEITESAYVSDSKQLLSVIEQLKARGFVIEMDDFGNGYSSLNTLSELPIDVLKIDLEFLRMRKNVMRRKQIMRFVINLASELRLQVIAEGAETEEQIALLREMGCEYAQGYFYGRPMPQEDFQDYLSKQEISEAFVPRLE